MERTSDNTLIENGLNKTNIFCTNCPSKILSPKLGLFIIQEKALPKMNQEKNSEKVESDIVTECFQINDIFHFENVGFTNTLDKLKYLTCSDCELGPIGWQNLETGKSFIALSRVRCMVNIINTTPPENNMNDLNS